MFADMKPSASDAPPDHPAPNAQTATANDTTSGTPGDEAVANDSNTATATDR